MPLSLPTDTSISSNISLLSTIPDADPEEEARELEGLQPQSPPLQADLDARILALALSRSKAATKHMLSNLHRMEGVTAFSAKELSGETLLGIRIDAQSRRDSTFGKPVYVLLEHRAVGNATAWVVARHSAPAWIGVIELARAFLPPPPPAAATPPPAAKGGGAVARQSVERFVKAVRARVVRWLRRVDAVETLREVVRGGAVIECDKEAAALTVRWADGTVGRCALDEKGDVARAVVTEKGGRRVVKKERAMRGSLEGLAARLASD